MAFNIESLIGGSIGDAFQKIMAVFKVDPTVALQSRTDLEKIQLELQGKLEDAVTAQIEVDKIEAGSADWVAANWRPAIGWVCGLGLFVQFIVNPLFTWISVLVHHPTPFPSLDLGTLMTLLFGMLGLGGMQHWEDVKTATVANGKS